jgi:uncharacterized protein (DUF952 family)
MTDLEPDDLVHLSTPEQWAAAQEAGEVAPPSLAEEGFVHCSTGAQVAGTIARHYADHADLVLLRLDPTALADDLRWEESRPGEVYPHVYRALRLTAVVAAVPWRREGA